MFEFSKLKNIAPLTTAMRAAVIEHRNKSGGVKSVHD